eukprot:CFRG7241T1
MAIDYSSLDVILGTENNASISNANVLVVGAGGIGCELLKNLVLSGFTSIEVIDLDTIDVSNLNRQFLFRKNHVGMSKAKIAAETISTFRSDISLTAHHADVKGDEFNMDYFRRFDVVLNALDNLSARNHVNRMCLAANVPLVESGTAGYVGQTSVIWKGKSECFECYPKPAPKTFPVCTIRNTPTLPIHCVVWAKYLFAQLFGEADDIEQVSPDDADPELAQPDPQEMDTDAAKGDEKPPSLREVMESKQYDGRILSMRVYHDDIIRLLSMASLWKKRKCPTPLNMDHIPADTTPTADAPASKKPSLLESQRVWTLRENCDKFLQSVESIKQRFNLADTDAEKTILSWDKDEPEFLDFVVAASNLRAYVFGIEMLSLFDIKSIAGNIIPAIASTNAIIAGYIVVEAVNILTNRFEQCRARYLWRASNASGLLMISTKLNKPNPKCYVCADKPTVSVEVDMRTFTLLNLKELLTGALGMLAPDVMCAGRILISSDPEDETSLNDAKTFGEMSLPTPLTVLEAEDFHQNFTLSMIVRHCEEMPIDELFSITAGADATPQPNAQSVSTIVPEKPSKRGIEEVDLDADDNETRKKYRADDDDDIIIF